MRPRPFSSTILFQTPSNDYDGWTGDFFRDSIDIFLPNSFKSIPPLQAYLLGVITSVAMFFAWVYASDNTATMIWDSGLTSSRVKRKKKSTRKRRNRNILHDGNWLRTTNRRKRHTRADVPFPVPPHLMAGKTKDKVYRALTLRIRQRAASRAIFRYDTSVNRHELEQCIGTTKLNFGIADIHPIASNLARYNQKQRATHRKIKRPSSNDKANDSSFSSGMIFSEPSGELFGFMNSQPLVKDTENGSSNAASNETEGITGSVSIENKKSNERKTSSSRTNFVSCKENINIQLQGNNESNDTTIINKKQCSRESISSTKCIKFAIDSTHGVNMKSDCKKVMTYEKSLSLKPQNEDQDLFKKDIFKASQARMMDQPSGETAKYPKSRLTILISNGVYDYMQAANQRATLDLLEDLGIPYDTVDGMDPLKKSKRDSFFQVSGIRGNYPQIFCSSTSERSSQIYLGGYDWLRSSKIEDLNKLATE